MNDEAESVQAPEDTGRGRSRDFFVIAVLLALVAVAAAAFAAGWALGRNGDEDAATFAHELEAWAECLGEAGAVVPEVTARDDGGFTAEFAADFFDAFSWDDIFRAADECHGVLPLDEVVWLLGVPPEFLVREPFFEPDRRGEWWDLFDEWLPDEDRRESRRLAEFLERLRDGDVDIGALIDEMPPGQVRQLCARIAEGEELPFDDGELLRVLSRICGLDR